VQPLAFTWTVSLLRFGPRACALRGDGNRRCSAARPDLTRSRAARPPSRSRCCSGAGETVTHRSHVSPRLSAPSRRYARSVSLHCSPETTCRIGRSACFAGSFGVADARNHRGPLPLGSQLRHKPRTRFSRCQWPRRPNRSGGGWGRGRRIGQWLSLWIGQEGPPPGDRARFAFPPGEDAAACFICLQYNKFAERGQPYR
jgi:hypothetical protein